MFILSLIGCSASKPSYVEDYANDRTKRIQLRAFFPEGPVFNLDNIFLEGDIDNYDVKIIGRAKDLSFQRKHMKTTGKSGDYKSNAEYSVNTTYEVIVMDDFGGEIVKIIKTGSAIGDTSALEGHGLDKDSSVRRAENYAVRDGQMKIYHSVEPEIVSDILSNPSLRQFTANDRKKENKQNIKFENVEIIICDKIKRGLSNDLNEDYVKVLSKSIKDEFNKHFKKVQITSEYFAIKKNQMIIQPLNINVSESGFGDAYYGKGGNVDLEAEIEVITFTDRDSFFFHGSGRSEESLLTVIPGQLLGVVTLFTYSKLQSAVHTKIAGEKAKKIIGIELLNKILNDPIYSDYLHEIEKSATAHILKDQHAIQGLKDSPQGRIVSNKLPFTGVLLLPPDFENYLVNAHFDRSIFINNERQAGTVNVEIGKMMIKILKEELQKRFIELVDQSQSIKQNMPKYNPHNINCIIDLQFQSATVYPTPEPNIQLLSAVAFRSPTGEIYKETDISSRGSVVLGTGGSLMMNVLNSLSVARVFSEGTAAKSALEAGCIQAINQSVEKILEMIDVPGFVDEFQVFSAYASAKQSKSIQDMKRFLEVFPESHYSNEMMDLLDDQLYGFAISSGMIEPCIEYIATIPNGKYMDQIVLQFEQLIFAEIEKGNTAYCDLYLKYCPDGFYLDYISTKCHE